MNTHYSNYKKSGQNYFYNKKRTQKQSRKVQSTKNIESKTIESIIKKIPETKLFSYAGSKYKFKTEFQNTVKEMKVKKVKVYIEGFAGALASMFHNLELIQADTIVINDFNPKLINFYKQVQQDPERVFRAYEMLENKYQSLIPEDAPRVRLYPKKRRAEIDNCRKMYLYIREELNKNTKDYVNAACWLFIMNHNFNGIYAENKKGQTNVSFNWNTQKINLEQKKENLYNLHNFFKSNNVVFENLDINDLIDKYNDNDSMIYLDPPYCNSEILYNKQRNKKDNNCFSQVSTHIKMLDKCSKYKYIMYSNNHNEEFIKHLNSFKNFERKGNINAKSTKAKTEILGYRINRKIANNIEYNFNNIKSNGYQCSYSNTDMKIAV